MAKFSRHIKQNKGLVFFTILLFLYTYGFSAYGSSDKGEQEELNQMADKLDKYFRVLEEVGQEIPRDTFDPQAVVDKVGNDPEALFRWVRDNTYLAPYRGVLRGPIGVLMDRQGNSQDRALLLHELLRLAGHESRLAHGNLSEALAREILQKARPVPIQEIIPPQKVISQELDRAIQKYSTKYQLSQEELRTNITKIFEEQENFINKITDRVKKQTEMIADALRELPRAKDDESQTKRDQGVLDHWWVQFSKGDQWIDLDPTLPETDPGNAPTEAEATLNPADLDQDLFHRVTVRVIVEQWAKDGRHENIVLEHTLKPADLIGKRVVLIHIPMSWPADFSYFEEDDPISYLNDKVLSETEWLPCLVAGAEKITQSSFTDSGEIRKSSGGKASLVGGLLGELGGEESDETEKESHLTAEWIEYEIVSPGNPNAKIRRQVFDLIGPAARLGKNIKAPEINQSQRMERGLAVLSEVELLFQVCQLSPYFTLHLMMQKSLAYRDILPEVIRATNSLKASDVIEKVRKIDPLPSPLYNLALVRNNCSPVRDKYYLDRPDILSYLRGVRQNSRGETVAFSGFDIVSNDVAVSHRAEPDSFRIRLEQGILDTNAEALVMGNENNAIENTSEIFAQTRSQGLEWILIKSLGDPALRQLKITNDARNRVEEDLAAGNVVLIPKKEIEWNGRPTLVWWRINAATGQTLGIGQNGSGQSLAEYIITEVGALLGYFACIYSASKTKRPCRDLIAWSCVAGFFVPGLVGTMAFVYGLGGLVFALFALEGAIIYSFAIVFREWADHLCI